METWTEKYRPNTSSEMMGCRKLKKVLNDFLDDAFIEISRVRKKNKEIKTHNQRVTKKKDRKKEVKTNTKKIALMLRGPPGIGKTTGVYAIANERNIPVIETNASDARTIGRIKDILSPATTYRDISSFFGKKKKKKTKKVVLIDEVDGISGTAERGSIPELKKIVENAMYPVVMISNEWKKKLKPIYRMCREYEVELPTNKDIYALLIRIAREEDLGVSDSIMKEIAQSSRDFRGAINDLAMELPSNRDKLQNLFATINQFFGATSIEDASNILGSSPINPKDLFRWIFENMASRSMRGKESSLCNILSLADSTLGHILSTQEWSTFPQFLELLKMTTIFLRDNRDRLQPPKWFGRTSSKVDGVMDEFVVSREEGRILRELIDAVNEQKSKK